MSPTPTNPTTLLREAADRLRAARFSGAITATPTVAALIGARLPLADWLEAEAAAPITAQHSTRCVDPQCTTLAALAVARRVLGTPTTPAASDERPDHALYTTLRKYGHTPAEAQQMIDTYTQTILTRQGAHAADRADLRDRITTAISKWHRDPEQSLYSQGADAVLAVLAAEAQQPAPAETEAHPAEHTWAAELRDPLANEWIPGTRYLVRDRAVNALAHARKVAAKWKDGTPTERRLVRATTTYTVEAAPAVTEEPTP
ncbi:hypothetical protein AB0D56_09840 [Streptomyces sp. NPDC048209]|uniref:hypothetical protein n=1 Tax=Streptomyces sp. NPDC048209 TaxID=3156689 RepID=UPI00341B61FE